MLIILAAFLSGLIPARAGKTSTHSPSGRWRPAHPRACGENMRSVSHPAAMRGSSPRVRGKPIRMRRRHPADGLIPARAGKTPGPRRAPRRASAHPRACGENDAPDVIKSTVIGSSPRVRGKPAARSARSHSSRLIPARAGKTGPTRRVGRGSWAHPRACGENRACSAAPRLTQGSSPRVRGKRLAAPVRPRRPRLIPARAGKTRPGSNESPHEAAHPRACGENRTGEINAPFETGSSPRVRGKLSNAADGVISFGLIPARAGKTSESFPAPVRTPAHPRACGENGDAVAVGCVVDGSSPRVRGKPRRGPHVHHQRGLIPARAGKTHGMGRHH